MTAVKSKKISQNGVDRETSVESYDSDQEEDFGSENEPEIEESNGEAGSSDEDILSQQSMCADEAESSDEDILSQQSMCADEAESSEEGNKNSALAAVMASLLSKNKTDKEILSKAAKDRSKLIGEKKKKKGRPLEILQSDGTIIKVSPEEDSSSVSRKVSVQSLHSNKRKVDSLFSDACKETDVVKEKKLRSLATKGVVQLFNTLEQYRQQKKAPSLQSKKKQSAAVAEMSAITSGNSGLIDFLATKTMGGDRQLFGEVKDEEEQA